MCKNTTDRRKQIHDAAEPAEARRHAQMFVVEKANNGFWCHDANRRSAGTLDQGPLSEILKWIVNQMAYGHYQEEIDQDGDVVSLKIGRSAPYEVPTEHEAAKRAQNACYAISIAGLLARARENGTSDMTLKLELRLWERANSAARTRIELHYAEEFCRLLGRISKNIRKLELLPIFESAPEPSRELLAEATRCFLFKMNKACIAICRACVEQTLLSRLTKEMRQAWDTRSKGNAGAMRALIDVCSDYGILGTHTNNLHDIREAGNLVLHSEKMRRNPSKEGEQAASILKKTRAFIGYLYQNQT